jgi:hypothetical protein
MLAAMKPKGGCDVPLRPDPDRARAGDGDPRRRLGDIAGTYSALGAGGAFAAGAGGVQLQNANGGILQLTGVKVGVELSASLAGGTIME